MAPAVLHAAGAPVTAVQVGLPVGSMVMRSPGLAASIAAWTLAIAATWVGTLPPMVTVTVSMDNLPLAAVMTNSAQTALDVPAGQY